MLIGLYPDLAGQFNAQLASDLAGLRDNGPVSAGREWGEHVGAEVLAARANDGSSPDESQPPGVGPGQFRAAWSGTQFRNLLPFAIADSSVYVSPGPPALTSLDYAAALAEVKLLGNAAIPDADKLATFQYWNLPAGTSPRPPGPGSRSLSRLLTIRPLQLPEIARLFALLGMTMADTVAPTYQTKFVFHAWRPATAIREADTDDNPNTIADPGWSPRAGESEERQSIGPDTARSPAPRRGCSPAFSARTTFPSLWLPIPRRALKHELIPASRRLRPRWGDRVYWVESTSSLATRPALKRAMGSPRRFYLVNSFCSAAQRTLASVPCKDN